MSAGSQHGAPERLALLERDAELAVIAAVIRDAECGSGSVAVVEAAAGLGKSALLGDTAMRASAAGLLVLRASGHQLERAFGWGVARALFEGLLRDTPQGLVGVLDGPVAPARAVLLGDPGGVAGSAASDAGFGILHALYWLVVRLGERRPTVLVVDDAHWADVPSLRFLAHLQPRIADLPVGLVIGARPRTGMPSVCWAWWPPIPRRGAATAAAERGRGRAAGAGSVAVRIAGGVPPLRAADGG